MLHLFLYIIEGLMEDKLLLLNVSPSENRLLLLI